MSEAEMERQLKRLQDSLVELRQMLVDARAEMETLKQRLSEAQERNRKLDWALTKAVESK